MDAVLTVATQSFALRCQEEGALIARCRQGEREAMGILLNRYRERVVNLAYQILRQREEAEDVAQDAFVRVFDDIHSFRGEAQFFTWLYRITVNLSLHRKRRARTWDSYEEAPAVECEDVESQAVTKLMVERALDRLSEPLRLVLILRELHQLSYEDIAGVLQIPVGTVRSRLNEGRSKFRQCWEAMK